MPETPNPGSDEAVERGCECPIIDNGHGDGAYKGEFIVATPCPLHGHGTDWWNDRYDEES